MAEFERAPAVLAIQNYARSIKTASRQSGRAVGAYYEPHQRAPSCSTCWLFSTDEFGGFSRGELVSLIPTLPSLLSLYVYCGPRDGDPKLCNPGTPSKPIYTACRQELEGYVLSLAHTTHQVDSCAGPVSSPHHAAFILIKAKR